MPVADVSKDPVVNQWLSSNDLIAHIASKDSPEQQLTASNSQTVTTRILLNKVLIFSNKRTRLRLQILQVFHIDLIQNRPSLKDLAARPCFCLPRTWAQPRTHRLKQGLLLKLLKKGLLYIWSMLNTTYMIFPFEPLKHLQCIIYVNP